MACFRLYVGASTPDADDRGLRAYGPEEPRGSRRIPEHGRGIVRSVFGRALLYLGVPEPEKALQ
jgi:hypothetical protein